MNFKMAASNRFPKAVWTGGGSIHASIARNYITPFSTEQAAIILASMREHNFGLHILRTINHNCPEMHWILNEPELEQLVLIDYFRFLHGQESLATKGKIQNPHTGNYFHRVVTVDDKWVGGIRFWAGSYYSDSSQTTLGWRFRLQSLDDELVNVRDKARKLVLEMEEETATVTAYINEQPPAVINKAVALDQFEVNH